MVHRFVLQLPGKAYKHICLCEGCIWTAFYRMDILINELAYLAVWTKNSTVQKRAYETQALSTCYRQKPKQIY